MAVTISLYNHTAKLFANGEVNIANLKLMLVGSGYTFAATETVMTNALAQQVSGNGWTSGGEALASAAVTVTTTNDATLDATDISVTASGGDIGPATGGVIYEDDVTDVPLFYINFDGSKTAGVGTAFKVTWNASGIATWTVT